MNQDEKFIAYLEQLKDEENAPVLESIITGFKTIVEYQVNGAPEIKSSDVMMEEEEPEIVVVVSEDKPNSDDPEIINNTEQIDPILGNADEEAENTWIDMRFSLAQLRDLGFTDEQITEMEASNTEHPVDEAIEFNGHGEPKSNAQWRRENTGGLGSQGKSAIKNASAAMEMIRRREENKELKKEHDKKINDIANEQKVDKVNIEKLIHKLRVAGIDVDKLSMDDIRAIRQEIMQDEDSVMVESYGVLIDALLEVGEYRNKMNVNLNEPKLIDKIKTAQKDFDDIANKFRNQVKKPGTEDLYVKSYNQRAKDWWKKAINKVGLTLDKIPSEMKPLLVLKESNSSYTDEFNSLLEAFDKEYAIREGIKDI